MGTRVSKQLAKAESVPWVIGRSEGIELLGEGQEDMPIDRLLADPDWFFAGYLLSGFTHALRSGSFMKNRLVKDFRARWTAVAVCAQVDDTFLARKLFPFVAPTPTRPYRKAPFGFSLYSKERILPLFQRYSELDQTALRKSKLKDEPQASDRGILTPAHLDWDLACWLYEAESLRNPVFLDPVLELVLEGRTEQERQVCHYRPPSMVAKFLALSPWFLGGSH